MPNVPDDLGERGKALWETFDFEVNSMEGALAIEACRAVDRLQELAEVSQNRGFLKMLELKMGDLLDTDDERVVSVEVQINSILSEIRQQQGNLRQMLTSLGLRTAPGPGRPAKEEPSAPEETEEERVAREAGALVSDFTQRRSARMTDGAG